MNGSSRDPQSSQETTKLLIPLQLITRFLIVVFSDSKSELFTIDLATCPTTTDLTHAKKNRLHNVEMF